MVKVQNKGPHVEYVSVVNVNTGARDTITVQAGGRVTLPLGYRVVDTGVEVNHLAVMNNDAPVSPLVIKE